MIKQVLALKTKSRERKKSGLFVIEGKREIELAFLGGYDIKILFYCQEIAEEEEFMPPKTGNSPLQFVEISRKVYEKLAHRSSTEGILAVAKVKEHGLSGINLSENPLLLIAESPEKPGNLGALLRTADAAGLDAVLIADPKSDIYNPNVVRSSVGCLFTNQIGTGTSDEIISFLREKGMNIYCAALSASKNYADMDFKHPTAIVVGTESVGLTQKWLENADESIVIPMQGEIDSMNVSVSAAILIFEAKRQRGF